MDSSPVRADTPLRRKLYPTARKVVPTMPGITAGNRDDKK